MSDEKKAKDFIPKVEKILGDKYIVEEASLTGALKASKGSVLMFRIFYSITAGGVFIVRLENAKYKKIASKVAKEIKLELVE